MTHYTEKVKAGKYIYRGYTIEKYTSYWRVFKQRNTLNRVETLTNAKHYVDMLLAQTDRQDFLAMLGISLKGVGL